MGTAWDYHNIFLSKLCNYVLQMGLVFGEETDVCTLSATQSIKFNFSVCRISLQLIMHMHATFLRTKDFLRYYFFGGIKLKAQFKGKKSS